jgi:hypothetical protein
MALKRLTLDEIAATPSQRNRAKLDATTEADICVHTIQDGHDPDASLPRREIHVSATHKSSVA